LLNAKIAFVKFSDKLVSSICMDLGSKGILNYW